MIRCAILSKMSPTNLTFANTQANTQSSFQFLVKNVGNQPASLTFGLANAPDPWFSIPNVTVPSNTQQSYSATFTPTNTQAYSDTATLGVTGSTVLCDVLPTATQNNGIVLSGTGTPQGTNVYSLSPSTWTFGHVAIDDPSATLGLYCGSAAGADSETFTIANGTVTSQTFTATATGGFTVAFPSGNTVLAGQQTSIVVSTPALTATSAPGSVDHGVLTVTIGGNT